MIQRFTCALLDLLILGLAAIWLIGGVPIHGKLHLSHAADLRRAAVLLALLGVWLVPEFRKKGFWVKAARGLVTKLEGTAFRWKLLAAFALVSATLNVLQALALRLPMYDVGIFHQILWNLSEGNGFLSTISKAGNFLQDHFSPALALLVPAFWASGRSPLFLPVLHAALTYAGIAAWLYLAERAPGLDQKHRSRLAAATTIFALSFESLWGNLRWGFHETAIAFAALSWALALLFSGETQKRGPRSPIRTTLILSLFVLAALSKETLLLEVGLGFVIWSIQEYRSKGRKAFPSALLLLSVVLVFAFVGFERLPHPADKNYFNRYYSYLGHDLGSFAISLLKDPWLIVRNVGLVNLIAYFKTVFLPWLFLPLAWFFFKRRSSDRLALWGLIIMPSFASAALSTYAPLRNPGFHYVLELWPVLASITILALAALHAIWPRTWERWIWAWALLAFFTWDHDPWKDFREYAWGSSKAAPIRAALASLPPNISVIADEMSGTWLAGRQQITRWPDLTTFGRNCPEVMVLTEAHDLTEARNSLKPCHASGLAPLWEVNPWRAYRILSSDFSFIPGSPIDK